MSAYFNKIIFSFPNMLKIKSHLANSSGSSYLQFTSQAKVQIHLGVLIIISSLPCCAVSFPSVKTVPRVTAITCSSLMHDIISVKLSVEKITLPHFWLDERLDPFVFFSCSFSCSFCFFSLFFSSLASLYFQTGGSR